VIALTVVASSGLSLQLSVGIAIGIAIGILIAQLGSPRVKRFAAAALVAIALVPTLSIVTRADNEFVITNPCKGLTPSDWEWWLFGCLWP
jgi:hypothetical protein